MLFLALAVACSTAIAVIFKMTEGRLDRMALLAANYVVAVIVAGGRLVVETRGLAFEPEPGLLVLGVTVGVFFIAGFALFSKAVGMAGMSLATATMRLSVAIPFVASWLVWGETPTTGQSIGLVVAGAAFVLISRKPAPETVADIMPLPDRVEGSASPWAVLIILALLFVVGGLVDTSMKVFEEEFAADTSRQLFMLLVFGIAMLLAGGLVVRRRLRSGVWPRRAVLAWGVGLGLVNYGSVEFILLALRELPGTLVFPANNVAIVGCATILGVVVWREVLTWPNRIGLVLGLAALILLTQ